jgi:transcriptional regulator with XRE-family HTH domain
MTHGTFGEDSPQRFRLGEALRELRRAADLTGEQLATELGVSQSKVSRIELGQSVPAAVDVERWTAVTGAPAEQTAHLLELAERAGTEAVAWRRGLRGGLVGLQQETAALEASAQLIRSFHPVLVPGLLQTPAYAKAVFTAAHPAGRADVAEAVAARMNRQAILYEETRRYEFVLAEAGLRWRLGPTDLLLGQLDRLGVVATLPNVSLGIIPLAAELHAWHSHGFVIFAERDGESVVHVETLTSALNVHEPVGVTAYQEAFDRLQGSAVVGAEARALLERIAKDLRQTAA